MEKAIQFKGISLDRSDQLADIGELAYCHGAELHGGILRPSILRKSPATRTDVNGQEVPISINGRLVYIHTANGYDHHISLSGNTLYFGSVSLISDEHLPDITPNSITSMGNTLIVNVPGKGLHYFRWNGSRYITLGQRPPEIEIQFCPGSRPEDCGYPQDGLDIYGIHTHDDSRYVVDENKLHWAFSAFSDTPPENAFTVNPGRVNKEFDKDEEEKAGEYVSGLVKTEDDHVQSGALLLNKKNKLYVRKSHRALFTEAAWALINRTHDHITSEGRFYAPFFVRYVYRMFDGSTAYASAPVLITPGTDILPQLFTMNLSSLATFVSTSPKWKLSHPFKSIDGTNITTVAEVVASLAYGYRPMDFDLRYNVSDTNIAALKVWADVITSVDIFISQPLVWYDDSKLIEHFYHRNVPYTVNSAGSPVSWIDDLDSANTGHHYITDIPATYPDGIDSRFLNVSTFFKLKSITLDKLSSTGGFTALDVEKNTVRNITTQEQLSTDDYGQYSTFIPSGVYNYNHRLNIYGIYEKLYPGFPLSTMCAYFNHNTIQVSHVNIKLSTDAGEVWVQNQASFSPSLALLGAAPLYYPDSRAVLMELVAADGCYTFSMKEHPFLNGSVTIPSSMTRTTSSYASTSQVIPVSDSILTSAADNPFTFPAKNASTVGTGQVLDLCTAVRPLSQGQFGSFPLIAFCTDGIWALTVGANGLYTAVNPISREVCAHKSNVYGSITQYHASMILQLDQTLMFTTDRGLNLLSGSEVVSLTNQLKGAALDIHKLFFISVVHAPVKALLPDGLPQLSSIPIINGNMDVKALYDWVNGRAIFFNSNLSGSCLIYTESDRQFSTATLGSLTAIYNSYPIPYVQDANGTYTLSLGPDYADDTPHTSVVVTRHIAFGDYRDVISSIRHVMDCATPPLVLFFGSNDGINDIFLGALNRLHANYISGKPYRYFRLALVLTMKQRETYSALILGITSKHNKL